MSKYLISFKPSGKYFFGNEKSFDFNRENSTYFIRSERLPLQTTLFGALRYILLPEKTFEKAAAYSAVIGEKSFDIASETVQSFGVIKSVSPVFLTKDGEWFIPTPLDHAVKNADGNENGFYAPFSEYETIQTLDGEKLYTKEYEAKNGTADSFMSLKDGRIESGLFTSSVQVGINRGSMKDGFFKREYVSLKEGFAFSVIADIESDALDKKPHDAVLLGQCKTAFSVSAQKYEGAPLEEKAKKAISAKRKVTVNGKENAAFVYFPGDFLVSGGDLSKFYSGFVFISAQPREYRSFMTNGANVKKGGELLRLIKAGSIGIPNADFKLEPDEKQKNAQTVGFNIIVEKE